MRKMKNKQDERSYPEIICIFPAMRYWGFINRLLDSIWIMETLFITNKITSHLKTLKMLSKKLAS